MVVYLDAFMGLNFLVDLCLLLGVNRLAGHPPGLKRAACAAAVGGGYAGMCLVPGFSFLANCLWRTVSLGIMGFAAFGAGRSGWRRSVLFVVLSMALGGLAVCLQAGSGGVVVCAGVLAVLCRMGLRGWGRRLLPLTVTYQGRTVRTLALADTGNVLRDPITGETVTVLSPELGAALGIPERALRDPAGALEPGLRLIPARTAGGTGLLAAVRCERVAIGARNGSCIVAFARENFGNGEYQALIGGEYG